MTSPARKPEEKIYSLLAPGVAPSVGRRLLARRCHNIIASSSSSLSIHTLNGLKPPPPPLTHPEWPRRQFASRVCLVKRRDMHRPSVHGSGALPIPVGSARIISTFRASNNIHITRGCIPVHHETCFPSCLIELAARRQIYCRGNKSARKYSAIHPIVCYVLLWM